ncbi:hypothetical protein E4U41_006535 [Claviceps citrina]|nr:hypothetical protein E4U41_006535 [Claviceps citrina]
MPNSTSRVSTVDDVIFATIPYYDGPPNPTSPIAGVTTRLDSIQVSVKIHDVRPSRSSFTLDSNGFAIVHHVSAVSLPPYERSSWRDSVVRQQIYDPEIIELAKAVTGAKKIFILLASARTAPFEEPQLAPRYPLPSTSEKAACAKTLPDGQHYCGSNPAAPIQTIRAKGFGEDEEEGPVRRPHKDWGPVGARNTLRNWSQEIVDEAQDIIRAEDEAATQSGDAHSGYSGRRWALYTTWRPMKPVKRDPMAFVDYRTADEEDGVSFWREPPGIYGPFKSDVVLTKANPKHKWHWISDQQPDEVLFMKIMDTESEKPGSSIAGGVHHCSFHLDGTENEDIRESLETKFLALW